MFFDVQVLRKHIWIFLPGALGETFNSTLKDCSPMTLATCCFTSNR